MNMQPPIDARASLENLAERQVDHSETLGHGSQLLIEKLNPGEKMFYKPGALVFRGPGIDLTTQSANLIQMAKQRLSGERMLFPEVINNGKTEQEVGLTAGTGEVVKLDMKADRPYTISQGSVLSGKGVEMRPRNMGGLNAALTGEKIFMLEVAGDGKLNLSANGTVYRRNLAPNEAMSVDPKFLVAFDSRVQMNAQLDKPGNLIQRVLHRQGGLVEVQLNGGTTGGEIIIQSMDMNLADEVRRIKEKPATDTHVSVVPIPVNLGSTPVDPVLG